MLLFHSPLCQGSSRGGGGGCLKNSLEQIYRKFPGTFFWSPCKFAQYLLYFFPTPPPVESSGLYCKQFSIQHHRVCDNTITIIATSIRVIFILLIAVDRQKHPLPFSLDQSSPRLVVAIFRLPRDLASVRGSIMASRVKWDPHLLSSCDIQKQYQDFDFR